MAMKCPKCGKENFFFVQRGFEWYSIDPIVKRNQVNLIDLANAEVDELFEGVFYCSAEGVNYSWDEVLKMLKIED